MDKQEQIGPNYSKIYNDLIKRLYPSKYDDCESILNKEKLSTYDVMSLNSILFNGKDQRSSNQRYKSYDKSTIIRILEFQKKNKLTNSQTAEHFSLSRNSVAKWKKMFLV